MPDQLKVVDVAGNMRNISVGFAKKQMTNRNAAEYFIDNLSARLEAMSVPADKEKDRIIPSALMPEGFKFYNVIWKYEPVDSKYFFSKMVGEGLYPEQQEVCNVMCGDDPFKFTNVSYKEVDLFWGKRSGKDATTAKVFTYQAYKLACMIDPHGVLGMGMGSSIDFVNVSKSGRQARSVFFQYLKSYVKAVKDVGTGRNWFASYNWWYDSGANKILFMDLREGEAVKKEAIEFGRGITCHSLNSDTYTGEGLNIVLGVIDELGSMPVEKVFGGAEMGEHSVGLYDSLKTTVDATSTYAKLVVVSYKYSRNCAMSMLVRFNKKEPTVYISRRSLYQVRPDFDRTKLNAQYTRNPIKAKMMYEVAEVESDLNNFYDLPFVLDAAQDVYGKWTRNPVKGKRIIIDDINALLGELEDWFVGKEEMPYFFHVDLAKGQVWKDYDAIGLAIAHPENMRVSLDSKLKSYMVDKMGVTNIDEIEGDLRHGVVFDLAIQIICKPDDGEVRTSDVRKFLTNLKTFRKFNFVKGTYDGWQSLESVQEFNRSGIDCEVLSVDKDAVAYATEKDLIMLGLYKIYPNNVWRREKGELIEDQQKHKIDHPPFSAKRFEDEGIQVGSKDLSDCCASVTKSICEEVGSYSNPVY